MRLSRERDGVAPVDYPKVIRGRRLHLFPKSIIEPDQVPTADQLIEVAVEAVKFTQKCNIGHRGFIAGKQLTAGPESGKNGSVYARLTEEHRDQVKSLMGQIIIGEPSEVDSAYAVGVYVASERRRATPADINGIGVVLANEEAEKVLDGFVSRSDLVDMPSDERQQFGRLLVGIESQAGANFGYVLHQLAR